MATSTALPVLTSNRFLVAKYVPDPVRMEPRNCGVILWNRGQIVSRFLGTGRDVPRRWKSLLGLQTGNTYQDWLDYWQQTLDSGTVRTRDRREVSRESIEFLDVLMERTRGNYLLVDGGCIAETLPKRDTRTALDQLFRELVYDRDLIPEEESPQQLARQRARHLHRSTTEVIRAAGLDQRKDFHQKFNWFCPVENLSQHFLFDYAIHDSRPHAVMQRVLLDQQHTVNNAAFMFEAMRKTFDVHCTAFVYVTPQEFQNRDVDNAYRLLSSLGTVVNTAQKDYAVHQVCIEAI